ncbi:SAM-dependent methyltransferase [Labrenzia sp. EL_13]|uniref:methyltransferase domain-containing protein n=1 Tax=Roseibium album TaxID=311410 RepID=UPI0018CA09D6|nr:SAM-dependent methyltransferase [Labrenzia sp. EL_13]
MENTNTTLLSEVADYYSQKLAKYGETPLGVDWNGAEGQTLRFSQLSRIIQDEDEQSSIIDLGCGYGALLEYLNSKYSIASYLGVDVSKDMVAAAQKCFHATANARFILGTEPDSTSDFGFASGIFNVRLGSSDDEWLNYLETTLDVLDRTSRRGFAFNCLTSYSDEDKKRDYLYYADPCMLFDLCKVRYSPQVALLHDYGLYEFTLLVRKV